MIQPVLPWSGAVTAVSAIFFLLWCHHSMILAPSQLDALPGSAFARRWRALRYVPEVRLMLTTVFTGQHVQWTAFLQLLYGQGVVCRPTARPQASVCYTIWHLQRHSAASRLLKSSSHQYGVSHETKVVKAVINGS
jgi:hypothetical protein